MAIDPDSFDEPVKDYVFEQTKSVNDLIKAMSNAGGFTATKLARAKELLNLQNSPAIKNNNMVIKIRTQSFEDSNHSS